MPYVYDSSQDSDTYPVVWKNTDSKVVQFPNGRSRWQYGYRSRGPHNAEVERAISTPSKWANTAHLIGAFEEFDGQSGFGYSGKNARQFRVNNRDYTEHVYRPASGIAGATTYTYGTRTYDFTRTGAFGITSCSPNLSGDPSDDALASIAGGIRRRTAPAQSEIDLTRSLGELRDAPRLFRASNYTVPRSKKQLGEEYLNWVFGVQPTLSDFQSMAETVYQSSSILREYVAHERRRMRRSGTVTLDSKEGSGTWQANATTYTTYNGGTFNFGAISGRGYALVDAPSAYYSSDTLQVYGHWSWFAHKYVRSFATYEYFIPRPSDFGARLEAYNQQATRVMGGGLTAATAYDLTPWTWLIDWFVDVGGILRYQQTVADNQMVVTNGGFTLQEEVTAQVTLSGAREYKPPALVRAWTPTTISASSAVASYRFKKVRRRPGSPYSASPVWDFTPQQAAIVGALGLSRGK